MLEHAGRTRRRKMHRSVKNACKNVYKNVTLASKILLRWAAMVKKHLKCHTYHWGYVKKLRLLTPNKISFGDTSKRLRGACREFYQKTARFWVYSRLTFIPRRYDQFTIYRPTENVKLRQTEHILFVVQFTQTNKRERNKWGEFRGWGEINDDDSFLVHKWFLYTNAPVNGLEGD